MSLPLLERIKIQAEVLVPLVKHLQVELGEAKANGIVKKGLGGWARDLGRAIGSATSGTSVEKLSAALPLFAAGDALDLEVLQQTKDALDFNVTRCRYATFYQELRAPELGFLLVCSMDYELTEGVGSDVELTRTQTLMQGASHCDFRWRRRPSV